MGAPASFNPHSKNKDHIGWFENPVYDLGRAVQFYGTIRNMRMEIVENGDFAMAYFPTRGGVGGALVQGPGCHPSATGVLIYLNADNEMDDILARVEMAGGRVIMPKTLIGEEAGSFALFIDSEGNRLALHEAPPTPAQPSGPARKAAPKKSTVRKGSAPRKKTARRTR